MDTRATGLCADVLLDVHHWIWPG